MPQHEVAIAVGADTVFPAGARDAPAAPTIDDLVTSYNRSTLDLSGVEALADPSMTLLNPDPQAVSLWDGISQQEAMTLFLGSLDPQQWCSLTSASGLGFSQLTNPAQQQLYLAVLDSKRLTIVENAGTPYDPSKLPSYLDELPASRIRLGLNIRVGLRQADAYMVPWIEPRYEVASDGATARPSVTGATEKVEAPRALKPGDLNYDAPPLRVRVPLAGVDTVGALVKRIGTATRVELYAAPHLSSRSLTVVGAMRTAPAASLLKALAFCVAGAYRAVGPAFVLTYDTTGIGTIKERWRQFAEDCDAARQEQMARSERELRLVPDPRRLPAFNSDIDYTDQQRRDAEKQSYAGGVNSLETQYDALTIQQKAAVHVAWQQLHPNDDVPAGGMHDSLSGTIVRLVADTQLQLIVPSLDQPAVILNSGGLFQDRLAAEANQKIEAAHPVSAGASQSPALLPVLPSSNVRAILLHLTTVAQVNNAISAMKQAGLNQLWLDVFSNGELHCASGTSNSDDILTAALSGAAGSGIAVDPVFDLLDWGTSKAYQDSDLTILREPVAKLIQRYNDRQQMLASAGGRPADSMPDRTSVDITSRAVQRTLRAAVRSVAAHHGVGAIIWRSTTLPGYNISNISDMEDLIFRFGYTDWLRLAFLRQYSYDPIDIDPTYPYAATANLAVPEFDDPSLLIEQSEIDQWNRFRADANVRFMRSLFAAAEDAMPAGHRVRVKVMDRHPIGAGDWFADWAAPNQILPDAFPPGLSDQTGSSSPANRWTECVVDVPESPGSTAPDVCSDVAAAMKHPGFAGFVIDVSQRDAPDGDVEAYLVRRIAAITNSK